MKATSVMNRIAHSAIRHEGGHSMQQAHSHKECSHSSDPFRNANKGEYNREASANYNANAGGSIQLSSKAQMMMMFMQMMNQMMGGGLGELMNSLTGGQMGQMNGHPGFNQGQNPLQQMFGLPSGNPGFGTPQASCNCAQARNQVGGPQLNPNAPQVAPGQTKEMKAGETVKGANGSLVNWGQDGSVNVSYQDKNGQSKKVHVKDGMISLDGGQPTKLENTGQLLKLPNGDVVAVGNSQGADGKKQMVRVAVSDSVGQVPTSPPQATNIYDISQMQQQYTRNEGAGMNINFNSSSINSPWGQANFMNMNISMFAGTPVTHTHYGPQMMNLMGVK